MDAYDSSYEGITPEDFTELSHWFDEQGILFLDEYDAESDDEESEGDAAKARPFSFDSHKKRKHEANWKALSEDIIRQVTGHYMGDLGAARSLKEHVTKFRASSDYR